MQTTKHESYVELAVICGVMVLLSATGIIWYAKSPLLGRSMDGLLLVAVCLIIGIVFTVQMAAIVRTAGWLQRTGEPRNNAVKAVQVNVPRR